MAEYQLLYDTETVLRTADQAYIPPDPANRDRQEYDEWLKAGGIPDPAVPPPPDVRAPTKLEANPVDPMDAATKMSVELYVQGIVAPVTKALDDLMARVTALEKR